MSSPPSALGPQSQTVAGRTKARDLDDVKPTNFSILRGFRPVFLPFGNDAAIYEQFYAGTGASCTKGDDDDESR